MVSGAGAAAGPRGDRVCARLRREGRGDGGRVTMSCAARSRRRWRTACWRMPTRPTTRTARRARIRAAPWCRRRSRSASSSASSGTHFLRAVALGYDVGTRVTMTHRRAVLPDANATAAPTASRGIFGAAAAAGCAASLDAQQMRWLLDYTAQQSSGHRAPGSATPITSRRRFVFGGMPARSGVTAALLVQRRLDRRGRHLLGRRQFLPGIRAAKADPADARGQARRALRDHAHEHQEVDGRLADPGAARRARELLLQAPRLRAPTRCRRSSCAWRPTRPDREQPRDPRHLPAAHGRRDAARQDRLVRRGARQRRA